jgi:DNA-3-methyladenine glycosylase II
MKIRVPEEFSFSENLKYLSRSSNECMYQIKDNRICKAIQVGKETAIVEIVMDSDALSVCFLGSEPNAAVRAGVEQYVREWFDLDTDLGPFYKMVQTDELLKKAINTFYGLRIMGIPDLFEALCWGILGQQINLPFAYTLKRRLVETFGKSVEHNGESHWLFPAPVDIAGLTVADFDGLQMTVKKTEYLIGVAKLMAEGKLTKEQLQATENLKEAEKMLVAIRGIGPWTANYVLMRCLRFPNAFPIDDVGLHNALKHLLGRDQKPSKEEILRLSSGWTGWEAYATFYLWRFLY